MPKNPTTKYQRSTGKNNQHSTLQVYFKAKKKLVTKVSCLISKSIEKNGLKRRDSKNCFPKKKRSESLDLKKNPSCGRLSSAEAYPLWVGL